MRWTNFVPNLACMLVLLLLVFIKIKASDKEDGFRPCKHIVKKWASSSLDAEVKEDKHVLRDMLYFLHVPRTGGRTYYHCFLKKLYSNHSECPRSYDRLRFDPRKSDCRLLVTHDDYSVLSKLPKDKISVVTILRDPVDRIFSTYEFSVEVAARFLVHPNLTSALRMSGRLRAKTKGVSTLDIWPWKYLVPWMREDLFARVVEVEMCMKLFWDVLSDENLMFIPSEKSIMRAARKRGGQSSVDGGDPYTMGDVVMPFREYISDPIAQDIIHNGATFQIAGLTNNSYLVESHEVRHCVQKYPTLGEYVLQVAKKRLNDMLYVGLTENHRDSATLFANVVGAQVISQLTGANQRTDLASENVGDTNNNMSTGTLMQIYEKCIPNLRSSQSLRRTNSFKNIQPANFTKEARRQVSEVLLQEIRSLNHLDVELYKYAQDIFANQQKLVVPIGDLTEDPENRSINLYLTSSWKILPISLLSILLLVLFIFFFINARRRISKVKL